MADVVLIITSIVFAILVIIAAVYFIVYFQHPDDKWTAWFPKIVVLLGLTLAAYNIFLLPLDVANQNGQLESRGKIPMAQINLAFYIATIVICLVGVPFTVFFYEGTDEGDGDDKRSSAQALAYAIKWIIPILIFTAAVIGVLYWFVGYATIGATRITGQFLNDTLLTTDYCAPVTGGAATPCTLARGTVNVSVSPLVYIVAIVSFAGWICFAVFGGVGLIALPIDLVQDFMHRPRPIKAQEYAERKKVIGSQAQLLMEAGTTLHTQLREASRSNNFGKRYRTIKRRENEFRKDVLILEYHYRRLEDAYRNQGGNFLWQLVKMILGIIGGVLSLFWIIHIAIYLIPSALHVSPLSPFLNDFFIAVNKVPFLGTAFYALFAFYLLACVVKGTAKLGMRLVFVTLHPMRIGETMMSSLVFNMGVILLCSLSVAQFCTLSFVKFAKYTANESIFGVQIQNLKGIQYGYDAFIFAILGFALITCVANVYTPRNKQRENKLVNW
ncbi:hypothetical protein HK097_010022 [Rhizophlyctis rosea]|uniref:LMBR1-like membrane protein n=1 Tax=Rhizophlyctis rosea TaxID=64517 RepID=A0AAD5SHM0_9FUNG|nr:hypothetical protein HK097_010022 [Rhizophlyctis rosea]